MTAVPPAARGAWLSAHREMGGDEALLSIDKSIPHVVDMIEVHCGKPGGSI